MGRTSKDQRDVYYRRAKEEGWRARSAFKLLQIDEEFRILKDVNRVVDLCAAPGSWSQVLSKKIDLKNPDNKVVSVDIQPMAPIEGIETMIGDITMKQTADEIIERFSGQKADLVICDGAPDVTGLHSLDEYMQSKLALNITLHVLKPGGNFLAKIFRAREIDVLYSQLRVFFEDVVCAKPKSSRQSSCEAFVVCLGMRMPKNFKLCWMDPMNSNVRGDNENEAILLAQPKVRYVTCGDLNTFDSDRCYKLDIEQALSSVTIKAPIQPPIKPAYARAVALKREQLIAKVVDPTDDEIKDFETAVTSLFLEDALSQ